MKYNPTEIDAKWQEHWAKNQTFAASNTSTKPKYYVLDMFPYPSGAGLHVGHPLGYIASDIVARYKRHQGFNVLHPQGYDSFGLPAEQYAIQTGQHPDTTTKENIARYREQLDKIGFSFDWSREVRTSNADYYKHTQWIFIQLFNSWYNKNSDKAENISTLISHFENDGNNTINAVCDDEIKSFTVLQWNLFSDDEKQQILLQYRLTYLAETEVNWCPALGTVLANDEIVNGVSERGGHTVIRKKMTQWSMRISAYAERLLQGLETIDWSVSIKESQRNWIGKSVGAMVSFPILIFPKGKGTETPEKRFGYMTGGNNSHLLIHHAKRMRKEPTFEEAQLWDELRNKKLDNKIRRQHLIGDYIVDFVCLDKKLIIEVDGGYHNTKEQTELDNLRTLELEQKHLFKVIRFQNDEVKFGISKVVSKIKEELDARKSIVESKEFNSEETNSIQNNSAETTSIQINSRETTLGETQSKQTISSASSSPLERIEVRVFTTRPDTIFGVTFMTLAPEHPLVQEITTPEQKAAVDAYIESTSKRSERERMADVKTISGVFTGAYAEHPFTKEPIPVWIGDYVLAGYGTGAVMAVPCGDERDYAFANFFKGQDGMPEIKNIFVLNSPPLEECPKDEVAFAYSDKTGFTLQNSDFLNGLNYKQATKKAIEELEKINQGNGKTNYRLRNAVFSRQRYWGEPFPVYYVNGLPQMIDAKHLPIVLPEVEKYLPTEDGQPPLGNATNWAWDSVQCSVVSVQLIDNTTIFPLELNTMPGWAGSSWYWFRYMDAHNENEFASQEAIKYWESVDLYIGGSEHATGHLLYSRFWNKFLKDIGYAPTEEPFKKLINQGMILGNSAYLSIIKVDYKDNTSKFKIICRNDLKNTKEYIDEVLFENYVLADYKFEEIASTQFIFCSVDISLINDITNELNIEKYLSNKLYSNYKDAEFIADKNGKFLVTREVEKMSKSKHNVVNPDNICNEYGADTLRLYEMFLGPLEQSKPWNTAGITGVFGFLKKLWRLYFDDNGLIVSNDEPSAEMYKSLHKTIKKVTEDIENFSFNTSVSQFMICVNELATLKCNHRKILEPLAILISPYAPHIAEELWHSLGNSTSISSIAFPVFNEKYLVESEKECPVSFNGKMRYTITLPLDLTKEQIEEIIMADERTIKQLEGKTPNKVIIVPGKIINLVG